MFSHHVPLRCPYGDRSSAFTSFNLLINLWIHEKNLHLCTIKNGRNSSSKNLHTIMTHSSTFLLPRPAPITAVAGNSSSPITYALIILNQRLPRFSPLLWQHSRIRVCADGGANRFYDDMPNLCDHEDDVSIIQESGASAMVPKLEKAKQNRAVMTLEADHVVSETIPGYGVPRWRKRLA